MTRNNWTQSVRRPLATAELLEVRDAARDLAQQGQHTPGKARVVFQTVADVAFIGTAVIGGALAVIHLWKALARHHDERYPADKHEQVRDERFQSRYPGQQDGADDDDRYRNHRTTLGTHR